MKIIARKSETGSVLAMSVIMCAIIGTMLGSYLVLINSRNQAAMRAMAWNAAIPVLEAGIEEALTHINDDKGAATANSWQSDLINGNRYYWKSRTLPDGSYYSVTNFYVTTPSPIIHSAGYVPAPFHPGQYVSRIVEVTATNPPSLFSRAIAANGMVTLSGNAVVDGFNSAGFASALDAYNTPSNRNADGGIATDASSSPAINVGSAHVVGSAVTGPGGTVLVAGGSVGDVNWMGGIEPGGWTDNTMNVHFMDNSKPISTYLAPSSVSAGGSNVTVLNTGTYQSSSAMVSNDKSTPIVVTGNATLVVPGDFIISGTGYVYIQPGASLTLYVGGRASISGGGVVNATGLPANFTYIGLPGNTVLNYSGSAAFIGTINAPEANLNLGGNAQLYGAVICNTFTSSGGSSVHYDKALRGGGIFTITSWKENFANSLAASAGSRPGQNPNP
jgi:hypothetical protein